MKLLPGPTDLWRFPITGEETWAGVDEQCAFRMFTDTPTNRRFNHVTTPQQCPRLA